MTQSQWVGDMTVRPHSGSPKILCLAAAGRHLNCTNTLLFMDLLTSNFSSEVKQISESLVAVQ